MSTMMFIKQNTRYEVNCTKFTWTLQNCTFFVGTSRTKSFTSENFRVAKTNQLCFVTFCMADNILKLHMDGYYLPLYLIVTLSCTKKEGTATIKNQTFTKHLNSIGKSTFSMRLCQKNLQYDTLTFLITIEDVREASSLEIDDESSPTSKLYGKKLSPSNLQAMYINQESCDVTFVVGNVKLHAHSVVVAAVSSHFLSVFSKNCLENKTRHIVDMTKDDNVTLNVLKGFLDFTYGIKSMLELEDVVVYLAIMANKYDIPEMQKACEHLMSDMLNKDTVVASLLFSVKHEFCTLKKNAVRFAKSLNIDTLKSLEDFQKLYQNEELMLELL
ncbi:hypothetical protein TSAR_004717 [Trichomalopsis sarcophagae]|uniref:BTB domain-containing protein n=1 Tax=Trichomalopsis sarcophagae TaxID=543379 RepID=A0A232FLQ3_9HYME|nr:hypothetical protein TSAR_004717 [Trichomalopsis sarcophagae]